MLGSACWALLAAALLSGCAETGHPSPPVEAGVPANGSFRFLADHDGRPLAWPRCRPITWKLNAGGVDGAVVEVVRDAVDRMAASSGFAFAERGVTDAVEGSSTDVPETLGVELLVEIVPDDATDLLSGSEWARTDVRPVNGRIGQAIVAISVTADGRLAVATGRCPGGRSSCTRSGTFSGWPSPTTPTTSCTPCSGRAADGSAQMTERATRRWLTPALAAAASSAGDPAGHRLAAQPGRHP